MNIYNPGNKSTVYSPMWLTEKLELPRDRATINAWCRSFFALDPDVNRIISQHAILPLKYFKVKNTDNSAVDSFFDTMNSMLGFPSILESIVTEYLVLGEVFIYAPMDPTTGIWSKLMIQNPDYIHVKRSIINNEDITEISLRPDENLRRLINSKDSEDIEQISNLTSKILDSVRNGQNIELDNFNISHLSRRVSAYEIRGTSVLNPLFRILKNENRTPEDKDTIKSTLGDINSANGIMKDVMYQRYVQLFQILESWINKKIYAPVAKVNGFYEYKNGEKEIIFPRVQFDTVQLHKDLKA